MKLKLCNNGLSVVGKNEYGMYISYSIEAEEYKQWLQQGNIPEPEFTDEELNQQRIASIKQKAGDIINPRYSIIKQLNITNLLDGYTQEDKTKMIDFINSIRAISNKAELEGTALEDIDWGVL